MIRYSEEMGDEILRLSYEAIATGYPLAVTPHTMLALVAEIDRLKLELTNEERLKALAAAVADEIVARSER